MLAPIKIGRLAGMTGTTPPTIRYYEEIGLLPVPPRPLGGQRTYDEGDVRRLVFIRRCRDFGFPIEKVRQMVTLMGSADRPCIEARDLAHEQLLEVRRKLRELRELERSIAGFVERCDQQCVGGSGADCIIIEQLSERGTPEAKTGCCG